MFRFSAASNSSSGTDDSSRSGNFPKRDNLEVATGNNIVAETLMNNSVNLENIGGQAAQPTPAIVTSYAQLVRTTQATAPSSSTDFAQNGSSVSMVTKKSEMLKRTRSMARISESNSLEFSDILSEIEVPRANRAKVANIERDPSAQIATFEDLEVSNMSDTPLETVAPTTTSLKTEFPKINFPEKPPNRLFSLFDLEDLKNDSPQKLAARTAEQEKEQESSNMQSGRALQNPNEFDKPLMCSSPKPVNAISSGVVTVNGFFDNAHQGPSAKYEQEQRDFDRSREDLSPIPVDAIYLSDCSADELSNDGQQLSPAQVANEHQLDDQEHVAQMHGPRTPLREQSEDEEDSDENGGASPRRRDNSPEGREDDSENEEESDGNGEASPRRGGNSPVGREASPERREDDSGNEEDTSSDESTDSEDSDSEGSDDDEENSSFIENDDTDEPADESEEDEQSNVGSLPASRRGSVGSEASIRSNNSSRRSRSSNSSSFDPDECEPSDIVISWRGVAFITKYQRDKLFKMAQADKKDHIRCLVITCFDDGMSIKEFLGYAKKEESRDFLLLVRQTIATDLWGASKRTFSFDILRMSRQFRVDLNDYELLQLWKPHGYYKLMNQKEPLTWIMEGIYKSSLTLQCRGSWDENQEFRNCVRYAGIRVVRSFLQQSRRYKKHAPLPKFDRRNEYLSDLRFEEMKYLMENDWESEFTEENQRRALLWLARQERAGDRTFEKFHRTLRRLLKFDVDCINLIFFFASQPEEKMTKFKRFYVEFLRFNEEQDEEEENESERESSSSSSSSADEWQEISDNDGEPEE